MVTAISASCSGGGAELVHVALRAQRVGVQHRRAERRLELIGRIAGGEAAGADGKAIRRRRAAVDDQRHLAEPGGDRRRGVQDVGDERRAADVGAVVEARLEVEVLGQRHDADRPDAGGEEAVDVGDRQAGVLRARRARSRRRSGTASCPAPSASDARRRRR